MTFELRPVGERAFLIDLTDAQERRRVDAALRRTSIDGVVEHVPAATTVLVRCTDPDAVAGVAAAVRALDLTEEAHGNEATSDVVELRVRYDGEGKPPVTDGPFAETKDLVAGWMLIDVDSRERALELASRLSAAPWAGGEPLGEWLELREVMSAPPVEP